MHPPLRLEGIVVRDGNDLIDDLAVQDRGNEAGPNAVDAVWAVMARSRRTMTVLSSNVFLQDRVFYAGHLPGLALSRGCTVTPF
jgi:hypothetical protein